MTDRIERFKARRQLQAQLGEQPVLVALPTAGEASVLLQQPVNQHRIDSLFGSLSVDIDKKVCESDVDAVLSVFSENFTQERFEQLLSDSRREVLQGHRRLTAAGRLSGGRPRSPAGPGDSAWRSARDDTPRTSPSSAGATPASAPPGGPGRW